MAVRRGLWDDQAVMQPCGRHHDLPVGLFRKGELARVHYHPADVFEIMSRVRDGVFAQEFDQQIWPWSVGIFR